MKILVKKTPSGLKPLYESDFDNYAKIPLGEEFEIEYVKRRNIKFHRKAFALFKLAFENQQDYRNLDEMRKDLIIVAGYYDEHINLITGEVTKVHKSISFSSMDETEFSEIYEAVKNVISRWLGIDNEKIENEILQYF
jgi:hypothetical protein